NDDINGAGDADTAGNLNITTAVASGSLSSLVTVGADEPASFGLTVIPNSAPVDSGYDSKGQNVLLVSDGTTLTGYVDVNGTPGYTAGVDRLVFTFALSGSDHSTWTFTLNDQLDHAPPATGTAVENTLVIDFSSYVTASDFDQDTIPLDSGSVTVTVIDDIPVQNTNTSSGTVEEEQLNNLLSTGNEDITSGPPDLDLDTTANFDITTAVASGSLSGLVTVGADEPASFGLVVIPNAAPVDSGYDSKGANVLLVSDGTTLTGYVDVNGTPGYTAGVDRLVFTFALSGSDHSTWTFTLNDQLDHAPPPVGTAVENSLVIDFSSYVTASDFDLDTIALDSGSVTVTVIDDIPVQNANTSSGTVEEEQLNNFVTATGFGSTGNDDTNGTGDADTAGNLNINTDGDAGLSR